MWQDPVVEELRAIRDAYAKRFDYDLNAMYRDLKEQELKSGWKLVALQPKRTAVTDGKNRHMPETGGTP